MKPETRVCDECGSSYYAHASRMSKLCPECSHYLYGYPNCPHSFRAGRYQLCHWDGSTTQFIAKLRQATGPTN
ncbi:MAG: hypothetical protein EOO62_34800 [Hymenobacter sp.]|nr:MAG: hypothetical protein EOO62_34800 [Hymenobacter sp.]